MGPHDAIAWSQQEGHAVGRPNSGPAIVLSFE
jgi:hypothetical protein